MHIAVLRISWTRWRFLGLWIALTLGLSACSTLPELAADKPTKPWLNDPQVFQLPMALFSSMPQWQYQAKVGVKTPLANEQASLVWRHNDQAHEVRLFGPLGAGAIRIHFDAYGVVLSDNSGVVHRGKSAEALLTKIVGWPIPIDALTDWLFAMPNPEHAYRYQLNATGEVSSLEQLGWTIQFSDYRPYHEQLSLPRKLVAVKQLPEGERVVVRLVTKAWEWE